MGVLVGAGVGVGVRLGMRAASTDCTPGSVAQTIIIKINRESEIKPRKKWFLCFMCPLFVRYECGL
ncbi:MAG: hypothetical protein HC804_06140 [Anaerolineae bacterium]|nr:hypothetical protein [Anaerolineae bacterium]